MDIMGLEAISYPLWRISIESTYVKRQSMYYITHIKLSQGYKTPCFLVSCLDSSTFGKLMKALGLVHFGQFMQSTYIHEKIARFKRFKLR